jgi:hypothetical protein
MFATNIVILLSISIQILINNFTFVENQVFHVEKHRNNRYLNKQFAIYVE